MGDKPATDGITFAIEGNEIQLGDIRKNGFDAFDKRLKFGKA